MHSRATGNSESIILISGFQENTRIMMQTRRACPVHHHHPGKNDIP